MNDSTHWNLSWLTSHGPINTYKIDAIRKYGKSSLSLLLEKASALLVGTEL